MLWDKCRAESIGSRYVHEAILNKRYAFASDFIRFLALYNYGGIYLDSDVEVLKSFNDLLHLRYFIGKENSGNDWEPAIIGAEAGIPWMYDILSFWKNGKKSFTDFWGRPRMPVLPFVCSQQLKKYSIRDCREIGDWIWSEECICRFPADWFSPKSWETLEVDLTDRTYCIHHFAASWHINKDDELEIHAIKRIMSSIRKKASFIKHNL